MQRLMARENQPGRKVALVLGGGGLKGFAHIGVLRALAECGIQPTVYAGTSIGGLIAAAIAGGVSVDEMEKRAYTLRKRDLFRLNHMGMLLERMRSPSIYLEEPLRALCESVAPGGKFHELKHKLLVNTVDAERGSQVVWGLPGLEDVWVQDAVYASCALPGFFPPGRVGDRLCFDGGVVDNLPAAIAAHGMDLVIAVDVGSSNLTPVNDLASTGFASIYMRAAATMMRALQWFPLEHWTGPPMVLIRPRLGDSGWFSFGDTDRNIKAGYEGAMQALADVDKYWDQPDSIFPRERLQVRVLRDRCTGCGTCAAIAPSLMGMDSTNKAFVRTKNVLWSPADGYFVQHCPTNAIEVTREEPAVSRGLDATEPRPRTPPLVGNGTTPPPPGPIPPEPVPVPEPIPEPHPEPVPAPGPGPVPESVVSATAGAESASGLPNETPPHSLEPVER